MKLLAYSLATAAVLCGMPLASAQVTPTTPVAPGAQPVAPSTPTPPDARSLPPTRWTALQIGQSFEFADSNSNGELTRAEAQQLKIAPRPFEAMDENKDGVVTRAEYEATFTR
jgi:EF hand domain-containing protein